MRPPIHDKGLGLAGQWKLCELRDCGSAHLVVGAPAVDPASSTSAAQRPAPAGLRVDQGLGLWGAGVSEYQYNKKKYDPRRWMSDDHA